jgi:hypothetical protein
VARVHYLAECNPKGARAQSIHPESEVRSCGFGGKEIHGRLSQCGNSSAIPQKVVLTPFYLEGEIGGHSNPLKGGI